MCVGVPELILIPESGVKIERQGVRRCIQHRAKGLHQGPGLGFHSGFSLRQIAPVPRQTGGPVVPTDGKGRVVGLHGRVSHEIDSVTVRSGEPEPTYRIHQGNENQLKAIECGVEGRVPVPSPRQSFHE